LRVKYHAAQPVADTVNAVARARGEAFLARYGGNISNSLVRSGARRATCGSS